MSSSSLPSSQKGLNSEPADQPPEQGRSPLVYILAVFLILLIVVMVVPYYGIRSDPEPGKVTRDQVVVGHALSNKSYHITSSSDYRQAVLPSDPVIKQVADQVAVLACPEGTLCHAKALYYFVRDNFYYVADPQHQEYVEDPKEFLLTGGGDCESGAILLSSLLESVGIDTQLVLVPGHALLRARLDAPKRFQQDGWVYLDWTCRSCGFGELAALDLTRAHYLEVP